MLLMELHKSKWSIYAVATLLRDGSHGTCMDDAPGERRTDLYGLSAILEHAAEQNQGPKALGNSICHQVDDNNEIWQISKGRLRLLWFYGHGGKIIICCNLHLKKKQKANAAEVENAIRMRERYFSAVNDGSIVFVDDDEEQ